MLNCICDLISTTLYLTLIYLIYKIIRGLQVYVFRKRKDLLNLYSDDGKVPWAAITGSTSGIGQALAHQLADIGFNILLISRSVQKLQTTQGQIRKKYPKVQVDYIKANLGEDSSLTFYQNLCEEINQNYDIGIFINNAAMFEGGDFCKMQPQPIHQMVEVNNGPYVMLLRYLLPKMMERGCRSGVVNVSSIAGSVYHPYLSVYSATKAFEAYFSRSLAHEVYDKIDVLNVHPGVVETKMSRIKKKFGVIYPEQCAKGILQQLGYQIQTYAHWNHATQRFFLSVLVYFLTFKLRAKFYRSLSSQLEAQRAKYD